MRVLAYVNHFFGEATPFRGKSTTQLPAERQRIVEQICQSLRQLPAKVDVRLCGDGRHHLLYPEIVFPRLLDPRHLVFASIEHQLQQADGYDYIINVEDDVQVPVATWQAIRAFDAENPVDRCLLPNRLEGTAESSYCVDLKAMAGWTDDNLTFQGRTLRVAINPHSGIAILSREKVQYARERVDLTRRDVLVGGHMASAYANLHSAFKLYRPFDDLRFAHVTHLDHCDLVIAPSMSSRESLRIPSDGSGIAGIACLESHPMDHEIRRGNRRARAPQE
jgi:hypothetical protein